MRQLERSARRWPVVPPACAFLITLAAASPAGGRLLEAQQSPPAFRAGVDLVTIDVQVTPVKNAPMRKLTAADFDISISGRKRPVVSVTPLHDDTGTVTRNPSATGAGPGTFPDCVFGFQRKTNQPTAHYVVGVEATEADRKVVKQVRVKLVVKAFAIQRYVWRSPIPRSH
jgi:hypothetical protein